MANKPLCMQKLRQILLLLERGYSERAIHKQVKVSRPTIHQYAVLFDNSGKSYSALLKLSDKELNVIARSGKVNQEEPSDPRRDHFLEQMDYFILELKKVGVTRYLLWQEYLETYPAGFQYSRFCELMEQCIKTRKPSMRFTHKPGEVLQVDFAGAKLSYVDRKTGEVVECPVIVGVLPFSGYSYVRALPNATLPEVVNALNLMLEFFGGVLMNALSDNMKQWVTRTCKYEPTLPDMLEHWALHNHIGMVVAAHGAQKLLGWFGGYGFDGTMGFFTEVIGLPYITALAIILLESAGMILLALGLYSRLLSGSMVLTMIGAILTTHGQHGFFMNWSGTQGGEGFEFHLLLIALSSVIMINGAGALSLDALIFRKRTISVEDTSCKQI